MTKFFLDIFFRLVDKIRQQSLTRAAYFLAHFLMPAFVLAVTLFFGKGVSIGFEQGLAISELKTEIDEAGIASEKRGVIVIAEPHSSELSYLIPLAKRGSRIWSSLDNNSACDNHKVNRLALIASGLYGQNPPISDTNEPVALVVEGELGQAVNIIGEGNKPVGDWRLASRRSIYLIVGVLISCSIALGIGAVIGVPAVNADENSASQIGTKPDKE